MVENELRTIELPEFLKNMPWYRIVDEVVDGQIAKLDNEIQDRHDDILISTATEIGIARREKILGILTDPDEDLESRRARVLFWWYNKMPYTRKVIEGKIAALCGKDNYTFEYDSENMILHVGIGIDLGWSVIKTVYNLLDELVMLNIIIDVKGTTINDNDSIIYFGAAYRSYSNGELLSDNA